MNPSPLTPQYNPAQTLARIVRLLLVVVAIVSGLSLISSGVAFLLPPFTGEEEFGENLGGLALALLDLGIALASFLVYLASAIFFLVWLYRSYRNLPAFGTPARNLNYSPGMAVGSFFIPFVNLVLPYRAVRDLWRNSLPADEAFLGPTSPPSWFPLWWFFWLMSGFVSNLYLRLLASNRVDSTTVDLIGVVSDALTIIAAVFAIAVVAEIDQRQAETSSKMKLGNYPPPPILPSSIGSSDASVTAEQIHPQTPELQH